MKRPLPLLLPQGIFLIVLLFTPASARPFYQLESALKIPADSPPDWDYLTYDQERSWLFVSRRHDGVTVYDAKAAKVLLTLEDTAGGNTTRLVPEFDRAYVVNTDGTATVFQLSTLRKLDRVRFGDNADNCFYDPVSKELMITMGDSRAVVFVDAATAKVTGTLAIDSSKLEGAAADGQGNIFLALRDRNQVIRIHVASREITARWPTEGCELLSGLDFDPRTRRIFVAGRGENPVLAVLDADTGKVIARPAIGRGNDAVIFDPETRLIYTANGMDGTLVIIQQVDADTYQLAEAATTRPYAKTMALDFKTKKVYLTTAEGTVDPERPWRTNLAPFYPNKFFPGTFMILTYSSR